MWNRLQEVGGTQSHWMKMAGYMDGVGTRCVSLSQITYTNTKLSLIGLRGMRYVHFESTCLFISFVLYLLWQFGQVGCGNTEDQNSPKLVTGLSEQVTKPWLFFFLFHVC